MWSYICNVNIKYIVSSYCLKCNQRGFFIITSIWNSLITYPCAISDCNVSYVFACGFVLLQRCLLIVLVEWFITYIHQNHLTGTGAIMWQHQVQGNGTEDMGENHHCLNPTKHCTKRNGYIRFGMQCDCNLNPLWPYRKNLKGNASKMLAILFRVNKYKITSVFRCCLPNPTSSHVYTPPASFVIRQWPISCEYAPSYCNITDSPSVPHAYACTERSSWPSSGCFAEFVDNIIVEPEYAIPQHTDPPICGGPVRHGVQQRVRGWESSWCHWSYRDYLKRWWLRLMISLTHAENKLSSISQLCRRWWHRKLSLC